MALTKISDFKNIHNGKRLFILASGPSLNDCDLSIMQRRLCMTLNRSCIAYPEAQYNCTMDQRLFDDPEYGPKLRQSRYLFTLEDRPFGIPIKLLGAEGFSFDLEQGIYSGYTIAYLALQVAVYMGFSEIYYVGLDLKLRDGNTHFFGKDFCSEQHEHTEFPKMMRGFEYGAKVLKDSNVKVFNCCQDSRLECFPKVTYEHAVSL